MFVPKTGSFGQIPFFGRSDTRSHQGTIVPKPIFLAHQNPISFAMNLVFILQASLPPELYLESSSVPKVVVFKRQFRDGSLVLKILLIFLLVCPKTSLFILNLTDKGRTTLVQKMEF